MIARDAGIAKGSLFQYFDDKLDLFTTVSQPSMEDLGAAMLEGIDIARDPFFDPPANRHASGPPTTGTTRRCGPPGS